MAKKWYVVHTYSGFENKAKKALEERDQAGSLEELFGEIMIPMENVVEMVKGEKRTSKRKFFPGYILVQMEMNDRTKHLVKNTPEGDRLPRRRSAEPIAGARQRGRRASPRRSRKARRAEAQGAVRRGRRRARHRRPVLELQRHLEEVQPDKQKVRVQISIFGRATPVTLDFMQVEKT